MLTIDSKIPGSKKRLFDGFSVLLPDSQRSGFGITLRELIPQIVHQQVSAFQDREKSRQFIRVLTERDISDGKVKGKIESGQSDRELQHVDIQNAVSTAIDAFEDGLYLVAIDSTQCTDLDARLTLQSDSRITFIRLTLLAGG